MKINGNEIRPGNVIQHKGGLWVAVKAQAVKPGKGPAYAQVELKNAIDGTKLNERFRASETVERVRLEQKDYQFLYAEGDMLTFMDTDTYDQIHVSETVVGDAANYLLENQNAIVATHEGAPLYVELPASVVLEITHTEPGLQGDRSTGGTKPATLETGAQINVPLFLETGTKVKVDTRDGSYLGRVND
jgi:elongation factor P